MDREYLEDYALKESAEFERLVLKKIEEGTFDFKKDRYPPDERFVKLQRPVAVASVRSLRFRDLWAQIPLCGSLILGLFPVSKAFFEENVAKVSEIPKLIDFIRETGKLQVVLLDPATEYAGLDYLAPFFKELKPPAYIICPHSVFWNKKEIQKTLDVFYTLGEVRYFDLLERKYGPSILLSSMLQKFAGIYTTLKLGHYSIVEDIENLLIDEPEKASWMLHFCGYFIDNPLFDLRSDLKNFTLGEIEDSQILPDFYRPREIQFPCEIGKFLLKKLTYAPHGLRACNELIDHYDAYDLRKLLVSLNEAIVENHPDIVNKSAKELSEVLDNVWNDKTIPRRVKGLEIGVPLSIAAIGGVAAGPIGAATGGFLAELGFRVADKILDLNTTGLSERLAKLKTRSYQANVYDFKKKYKGKIRAG